MAAHLLASLESTDSGLIGVTDKGERVPLGPPEIYAYETSIRSGGKETAVASVLPAFANDCYIQFGELMLTKLSWIKPGSQDIPGQVPFNVFKKRG